MASSRHHSLHLVLILQVSILAMLNQCGGIQNREAPLFSFKCAFVMPVRPCRRGEPEESVRRACATLLIAKTATLQLPVPPEPTGTKARAGGKPS